MVARIGDMMPPVPGTANTGNPGTVTGAKDFAAYVQDAAVEAVGTMHRGEDMSKAGIAGKADLNDVVAAVNDAEVTLQTVTTLRDKLVQAYQEILRMPI
ncbi:MAG: flagellar hook-basal body complex protein FliE [Thalassobaculum sp.]|uniref:flagellar hook-basal body complex protein FliE n=1 Tax=Thalassobaculum sp. TaxID=2022740 RepID=UPI0032F048CE